MTLHTNIVRAGRAGDICSGPRQCFQTIVAAARKKETVSTKYVAVPSGIFYSRHWTCISVVRVTYVPHKRSGKRRVVPAYIIILLPIMYYHNDEILFCIIIVCMCVVCQRCSRYYYYHYYYRYRVYEISPVKILHDVH